MERNYASRMENMRTSEIREILKVTQRKELISFAGGLPAPELFPVEEMKIVSKKVLEESGSQALQYTTTEGFEPLRLQIANRMNEKSGTKLGLEEIQIVSGSQQALDMTGKLFLDEDDVVVCEKPTYLGAINAFKAYCCKFIEVESDEEGMDIIALEKILKSNGKIKLIYVIPDFQNPTGKSWSIERRKDFIEIVNKYEVPVIEDNPYGEVTFRNEIMPLLKAFDTKELVITLGTFSKILCPGMRIGWIAAAKDIIQKYILIKQSSDLHTSNISQREISKYMELYDLDEHIEIIKKVYKRRRDLAVETMKTEFPDFMRYTIPEGGLFTWVEGPETMDSGKVLKKCLENGVAFVPGHSFFPNGGGHNTFRLNYSNATDCQLVEGFKRLAKVLKEYDD
ncbi:MAG: aminotransferase [Firmicutes bacterium HGW-Firmicutes-7]|nr:MAG: aminotransferase [Firmicutes bacterium HGW-Firmicutes-7]